MTTTHRVLIVDDEPPAIRLLEKYVARIPALELVKTTTSGLEALQIIEHGGIDLVLMDIQMPELTGIQLSKIVKGKCRIIFTTAYPQFAIESYELDAVDYLLKPIEFERFHAAVMKVVPSKSENAPASISTPTDDYIFVKTDGKNNFERIYIKDIQYIEGLKNYVAIHLHDRRIVTYNTLKNLEENLPTSDFFKTHRSYIVSFHHIERTDSHSVFVNGKELPLGDTYRKEFFEKVKEREL